MTAIAEKLSARAPEDWGVQPVPRGAALAAPVRLRSPLGRPRRQPAGDGRRDASGAGAGHAAGAARDRDRDGAGDGAAGAGGHDRDEHGRADDGGAARAVRCARVVHRFRVEHRAARRVGGAGDHHHGAGGAGAERRIPGFSRATTSGSWSSALSGRRWQWAGRLSSCGNGCRSSVSGW